MRKSLKRWLIPMSAAMIALLSAGTAFAADTVNVKVENTRGGYVQVYYWDANDKMVYLPIGESCKVEKGTRLHYYARALDFHASSTERYEGIITDLETTGVVETDTYANKADNRRGELTVTGDSDVVIKGIFNGYSKKISTSDEQEEPEYELDFKVDNEYIYEIGRQKEGEFSEQLYLYDTLNDKVHSFNNVTIDWDDVRIEYINEDEEIYQEVDEQLFTVDSKGILKSTKALSKGYYYIDGTFSYDGSNWDLMLMINVGSRVDLIIPLGIYQNYSNSSSFVRATGILYGHYIDNPASATFNSLLPDVKANGNKLSGHELIGFGEYRNGSLTDIGGQKVSSRITNYDATARVYGRFENYKIPVIAHLTKDDIVPEIVSAGWNKVNNVWHYYETTDPSSLVKNRWLPCYDNDGEEVWVDENGIVVKNGVVKGDVGRYLVDSKGHKMRNAVDYVIGNVEYTTDDDGMIIASKLHLATPSDATKADQFVDDVMDNMGSLSEEDQKKAADMVTESLKKNDTSNMTPEETKKYADLYREVYGDSNIGTSGDVTDENALIVAAGLTSKDFEEDGTVTIEIVSKWLATSSNAVKVEFKLYVNGKERELTAPVETGEDLPEAFVASYSNATYKYNVSPAPASYKIENGRLTITITKTGVYTIQAARKSSGSSGSRGGSSSGGGRATVNAGYKASTGKTGNWVHDSKGWWFKYQDATWPKSEWVELEWNGVKSWYYFGADGYMKTGWFKDGGKWYYLHPYADGTCGYMYIGWREIGGKWYYFRTTAGGPKGSLVVDGTTPDGYKVNANGEWVK